MPLLVSDLIQQSFEDMAVVQPGETISAALMNNAFPVLNEFLNTLSAEQYAVFTQTLLTFALQPNQPNYTLGVGGSWNTASRIQKVVGWSAVYNNFRSGGAALKFPDFQAVAKDPAGSTSAIPLVLGADQAYPLLNVRVFPTPSFAAGSVELDCWQVIPQFASTASVVNLPVGYYNMLHFQLAIILYPKYARVGGMPPELAANAQNALAALVQQNTGTSPQTGQ